MRYFTNRGVLEEVDDYTYKIPTRRKTIEASEVETYCATGESCYECEDTDHEVVFDEEQLLILTIKYFMDMDYEDKDFQYVDRDGNLVGHPVQGYATTEQYERDHPEPEIEEVVEETTQEENEYDDKDQMEDIRNDFFRVLDDTNITSLKDGRKWVESLNEIYSKSEQYPQLREDLDYAIEERRKLYKIYMDGIDPKKKKSIQAILAQCGGMRAEHLKTLATELTSMMSKMEKMSSIEARLDKENEWLDKYEKFEKEVADYKDNYYDALESCLKNESDKVYLGYMLEEWRAKSFSQLSSLFQL